jgi:tetratricopeptide (TPR) repeat protein
MEKSVLADILRSLDRKEMRAVGKWLKSPAHNQREDTQLLFDFLCRYVINGQPFPDREVAWKAIFPREPFDDARMRQSMFFLLKVVEEYLVFTELTADKVQVNMILARVYRQRKLDKAYRQVQRLGTESLQSQPLRNGSYLLNKFFLEKEDYEHKVVTNQNAPVNLQETDDALDYWYVSEKLRTANSMLAHKRVFQKVDYNQPLLEHILPYVLEGDLVREPAVAAQYYAYMAIKNPAEEHYFDRFEVLIQEEAVGQFEHSEMRPLFQAALNYCAAKVNQGNLDYCRRALHFYRIGSQYGLLLENNKMTRYMFGNAVAFAIKIGEFDWAEQFIEKHQDNLEEKERNSIVHFNLARLYFEKGDYDKAQRQLMEFEYDDMLLNIIGKTMLLKVYYEQSEYDAFESLLDSMRIYLKRKEALDPARKTAYKNMISLMRRLLNLNPYSQTQTSRLAEQIREMTPVMERDWLLKQVEQHRR